MAGYGLFVALVMVMKFAPGSMLGGWLNRTLVELPLEKLAGFDQRHMLYTVILVALMLGAGETLALLGSAEFLSIYAWDLAIYLDAVAVSYALAAVARVRSALRWVGLRIALPGRRGKSARDRRTRPVAAERSAHGADNDDDPAPAFRFAA